MGSRRKELNVTDLRLNFVVMEGVPDLFQFFCVVCCCGSDILENLSPVDRRQGFHSGMTAPKTSHSASGSALHGSTMRVPAVFRLSGRVSLASENPLCHNRDGIVLCES